MNTELVRVSLRLPKEKVEQIDGWARDFGMARSAYLGFCVQLGLNFLDNSLNPEKFLTPGVLETLHQLGIIQKPDK